MHQLLGMFDLVWLVQEYVQIWLETWHRPSSGQAQFYWWLFKMLDFFFGLFLLSLPFQLLTLSESFNVCTFWNSDLTDPCLLDFDMGTQCKEYQVMWFFDYKNKICTQIWYGGCGGNANRFETEADCISRCLKPCKYHMGLTIFALL